MTPHLTALPTLAVEAPTTAIMIHAGGTNLFLSVTVADVLNEISNALDDLEIGDLERIAQLARAARERQNDCSELPLFAAKEG